MSKLSPIIDFFKWVSDQSLASGNTEGDSFECPLTRFTIWSRKMKIFEKKFRPCQIPILLKESLRIPLLIKHKENASKNVETSKIVILCDFFFHFQLCFKCENCLSMFRSTCNASKSYFEPNNSSLPTWPKITPH